MSVVERREKPTVRKILTVATPVAQVHPGPAARDQRYSLDFFTASDARATKITRHYILQSSIVLVSRTCFSSLKLMTRSQSCTLPPPTIENRSRMLEANCRRNFERRHIMAEIFKITELVGTSPTSFAEAVRAAVEEAAKTVRNMSWFQVVEERGRIDEGKVTEFQVTIKVGFKLER